MRVRVGSLVAVAATLMASGSAGAQEAPPAGDERVAQVGAVAISKADYDHWFAAAAHAHFGRPVELAAPEYERCVAVKRRRRAADRWRPLDGMELRRRCQSDHRMVRRQVLQFLIQAQWVEQEAVAQGVRIGPRGVDRLFESQKRAAFPTERAYRRFLRTSGAQEADIKLRIRLDALQNRITRRVTGRAKPVTARDVARYRAAHPRRFAGMPRGKAERRVRGLLRSQREQLALAGFIEGFRDRYRALTWCAPGYAIAECGAIAPAKP